MSFQPTGDLAVNIFKERYALTPEETWEEACLRVAGHIAQAESEDCDDGINRREHFTRKFYTETSEGRFMPGGRIWFGAGRPQGQMLNCFVVPVEDSMEGWMKAVYDTGIITSRGGGVGLNLSPSRPRGAIVNGNGGVSTGAISPGRMINSVGDELVGGGGRRIALMLCLGMTHPDIVEFLDEKLDHEKLNNANVSVVLDYDPTEFANAVKHDTSIVLQHGGNMTGYIPARDLWQRIVSNAWAGGEPGILNGYLANMENNIWYRTPLISTNPCGEIWLEPYGSCDLGALVLPNFVHQGQFDWWQFRQSIKVAVRFLDDVLTVNKYPLPELEDNCLQMRRLGLGVMGLHNMLLELGMKYSSPEALAFIDKLFEFLRNTAYSTSVDLAREKGSFPAYDERMLESGYMERMPEAIKQMIRKHGIRNCALLTIAPTGTTSQLHGVSGGIEPLYAPVYVRTYWVATPDGRKTFRRELVVDPMFEKYPDLCEGAMDLVPRAHFEIQKTIQNYIDNAVSKTINIPENISVEELGDIWLEYLPYCKGTTIYRDGSRCAYDDEGRAYQPMSPVKAEDVAKAKLEYGFAIEQHQDLQNSLECPDGLCDIAAHRVGI